MQSLSDSHLELDFSPEISDDLFRLKGDFVLWSNASLPYLMMDAALLDGDHQLDDIRYMLVDVSPCENHHFEISKNKKVPPGTYNLTLRISGPEGPIKSETRGCLRVANGVDPAPSQIRYIFVTEEGQKPSVISGRVLKNYLEEQEVANASNATAVSENISSLKSYLERADITAEGGGRLVASTSSNKYHHPDCRYATKIKDENRIYFANEEEAKSQGYLPCRTCNP